MTRSSALLRAGYSVSSPRTLEDTAPLMKSADFLAVLIGNSIPPKDRTRLIKNIRRVDPREPLIYVTNLNGDVEDQCDYSVNLARDFGRLLEILTHLEKSRTSTSGEPRP